MDPKKCVVLVPIGSRLEDETQEALGVLDGRGYTIRTLIGGSQIDLARSQMATRALEDGFEETLWVDSDIAFHPDDVEKLRAHGLPLVAGLYSRKGRPEFAAAWKGPMTLTLGKGGGPVAMQYVGMGFTLIRRCVYETIEREQKLPQTWGAYDGKPIVPYFLPLIVPKGERLCYLSEDYTFCERARQAGFETWADTRIKLGHIGRYAWTWDDFAGKQRPETLLLTIQDSESQGSPPTQEPPAQKDVEPMSAKLYEQLGRKQELIDDQHARMQEAIQLLARIAAGEIKPWHLTVDMASLTYSWDTSRPEPSGKVDDELLKTIKHRNGAVMAETLE